MARFFYELRKNNNSSSKSAGKFFAFSKSVETMDNRKMSKHIAEHGSVYTPDVIYGVLEKYRVHRRDAPAVEEGLYRRSRHVLHHADQRRRWFGDLQEVLSTEEHQRRAHPLPPRAEAGREPRIDGVHQEGGVRQHR